MKTEQEIREYIQRNIDRIRANHSKVKGMSSEMIDFEIRGFVCGAVKAFRDTGFLTEHEAIDIAVDLSP